VNRVLSATLVAVATGVGIAASAEMLHGREKHFPLAEATDRFLYLRSGRTADRLALTFDSLVADVYWIRTIQHYGRDYKNRDRTGRFEYCTAKRHAGNLRSEGPERSFLPNRCGGHRNSFEAWPRTTGERL